MENRIVYVIWYDTGKGHPFLIGIYKTYQIAVEARKNLLNEQRKSKVSRYFSRLTPEIVEGGKYVIEGLTVNS